jgi:hypothetical protein
MGSGNAQPESPPYPPPPYPPPPCCPSEKGDTPSQSNALMYPMSCRLANHDSIEEDSHPPPFPPPSAGTSNAHRQQSISDGASAAKGRKLTSSSSSSVSSSSSGRSTALVGNVDTEPSAVELLVVHGVDGGWGRATFKSVSAPSASDVGRVSPSASDCCPKVTKPKPRDLPVPGSLRGEKERARVSARAPTGVGLVRARLDPLVVWRTSPERRLEREATLTS